MTGEWVSETEIIETAAELVELYNPADIYAAFAEAAREAAGLAPEPTGGQDLLEVAGIAADGDRRARRATRTPPRPTTGPPVQSRLAEPEDEEDAARRLYDLALTFQERSQRSEARLIEQFEDASTG